MNQDTLNSTIPKQLQSPNIYNEYSDNDLVTNLKTRKNSLV